MISSQLTLAVNVIHLSSLGVDNSITIYLLKIIRDVFKEDISEILFITSASWDVYFNRQSNLCSFLDNGVILQDFICEIVVDVTHGKTGHIDRILNISSAIALSRLTSEMMENLSGYNVVRKVA